VDIIHVNEVTYVISAWIAKRCFKVPMVVHVRSSQRIDGGKSLRTRWLNAWLKKEASAIVAIDETTRATLPWDLSVDVIHNSFSAERSEKEDSTVASKLEGLRGSSLKVGFIGNLHRSKGILELVEAGRLLRDANVDVEFLIVGGVTRVDQGLKTWLLRHAGLEENAQSEVIARIERYGLEELFHLLGPTTDIQAVYERMDVVCFPSYYDAPGRPVFEAAFSGVPSIVCVRRPLPDTLIHGRTGLAIDSPDAQKLAEAIRFYAENRDEMKRMGAAAKALAAANFVPQTNAGKVLDLYSRITGRSLVATPPV
jgi:glycosyltransferase involved in cell wall biosynthesis